MSRPALSRFRAPALAVLALAGGACHARTGPEPAVEPPPRLVLEVCVRADGTASETWTEGIAVALGWDEARALAVQSRPLTPEARAWLGVLADALPRVAARTPALAEPFGIPPLDAVVAAGDRGSSDGFGWAPDHIGINVQAFHEAYGAPDAAAVERMQRIVAHEYVHLLTYAAYPHHATLRQTPFARALWTLFFEGIGDYVSLSARWEPAADGTHSAVASATLARLEPVLVSRMEALAQATPAEEDALRAGISMGKFDEKWGSLPVALWLRREAALRGEREVLAETVRLGPDAVLPLALRQAAPELRPRLAALAAASR
jgi:hypothetical protein